MLVTSSIAPHFALFLCSCLAVVPSSRARRDTQAGRDAVSSVLTHSKSRSLLRTAQAIRASLLASAIASTLWCSRFLAASIQGLSPWRSQLFGLISPRRLDEQDAQVAIATLRYLAENYAIPSRGLLGDKPQPSGEVAAFAERIAIANGSYHCAGDDRPDPRHAHQPLATGIPARDGLDLARQALDALIEPAPVASQFLDRPHHARREDIGARTEDLGELSPQETQALADCNAALQEEGADLVDDAGALADEALAHSMQRLQVELFGRLGGNELHRRALNGFGDRLGIAEVVLLPLGIRTHVLRRHQPGIVTKHPEPATEVMGADAGFHADQARRNVRESCLHLATRPLLPQRNCAPVIEAHDVERVLADIDANHGNRSVEFLRHGMLLVLAAPVPALLAGGAGARPDHSITGHHRHHADTELTAGAISAEQY